MAGREYQLETLVKQGMEAGCQDGEGCKLMAKGGRFLLHLQICSLRVGVALRALH